MLKYIINFIQQWVNDHIDTRFEIRGPLIREVGAEIREPRLLIQGTDVT